MYISRGASFGIPLILQVDFVYVRNIGYICIVYMSIIRMKFV